MLFALSLVLAAAPEPYAIVLGVAQDAGVPQAGTPPGPAWTPERRRLPTCLGLVEPSTGRRWLFEATPALPEQLADLDAAAPPRGPAPDLAGIFLTHGHMGHYTGLLHFGHEAMGAPKVLVYGMPRMRALLRDNEPWALLLRLGHVRLEGVEDGIRLGPELKVEAFLVPHRDELTETVGYVVTGPRRKLAFVPDIDKWRRWGPDRLRKLVQRVDRAYVDGTFYADGEIPGRAMADIPHPFMQETLQTMSKWKTEEREKVRFIHLNRTNPALWPGPAREKIEAAGARVAERGERFAL
ncbi:MAG: MBL fold metallo-hydrolase [Myxococcota bacterium]